MPKHNPTEANPKIEVQGTTSAKDGSCNFCDRVISEIMNNPERPRHGKVARITFIGPTGKLQSLRVCYRCVPGLRDDLKRLRTQLLLWAYADR